MYRETFFHLAILFAAILESIATHAAVLSPRLDIKPITHQHRAVRVRCKNPGSGLDSIVDLLVTPSQAFGLTSAVNANQAFQLKQVQSVTIQSPRLDYTATVCSTGKYMSSVNMRLYAYDLSHCNQTNQLPRVINDDGQVDIDCAAGSSVHDLFPGWDAKLGESDDCTEAFLEESEPKGAIAHDNGACIAP
jgi:hypothetical protein